MFTVSVPNHLYSTFEFFFLNTHTSKRSAIEIDKKGIYLKYLHWHIIISYLFQCLSFSWTTRFRIESKTTRIRNHRQWCSLCTDCWTVSWPRYFSICGVYCNRYLCIIEHFLPFLQNCMAIFSIKNDASLQK